MAALIAFVAPHEAGAQSLFQSLFGNMLKSPPSKPAPTPAPAVRVSPKHQGAKFAVPGFEYREPRVRQSYSGGAYRTVCVRTCDGYYFPISGSTSRREFRKDAKSCSARCGGGKLYYLPRSSENMAAMVDLSGRRYDQLKSAFVYRKKLIDGCACRPMPWTAAERARHNRYAYAEEILRLNEERAKKLREHAIAGANHPDGTGSQETSPAREGQPAKDGAAVAVAKDEKANVFGNRVTRQATVIKPHETTDSAYFAIVKAAISDEEAASAIQGPSKSRSALNASGNNFRRPKSARATKKANRYRKRKTKRKSAPQASWSLAGGGKYTWPGDR